MGRSGVIRMRWLGVALLALALAGCGFQLRGAAQVSPSLQPLQLEGYALSPLMGELRRALRANGVALTEGRQGAAAALQITEDRLDRRVLSVGGRNRPREHQLTYLLGFAVVGADGAERIPPQRIVVQREYAFDETGVLGKEDEAEQLHKEMIRDAVHQLLRRLAATN